MGPAPSRCTFDCTTEFVPYSTRNILLTKSMSYPNTTSRIAHNIGRGSVKQSKRISAANNNALVTTMINSNQYYNNYHYCISHSGNNSTNIHNCDSSFNSCTRIFRHGVGGF